MMLFVLNSLSLSRGGDAALDSNCCVCVCVSPAPAGSVCEEPWRPSYAVADRSRSQEAKLLNRLAVKDTSKHCLRSRHKSGLQTLHRSSGIDRSNSCTYTFGRLTLSSCAHAYGSLLQISRPAQACTARLAA